MNKAPTVDVSGQLDEQFLLPPHVKRETYMPEPNQRTRLSRGCQEEASGQTAQQAPNHGIAPRKGERLEQALGDAQAYAPDHPERAAMPARKAGRVRNTAESA